MRFRLAFHEGLFVIAFLAAGPLGGFIQIIGLSVGIHVHQLDGEVPVLGIRRDIKREWLENLEANSTSILIFSQNDIMIQTLGLAGKKQTQQAELR
jgi:hypothetical protein